MEACKESIAPATHPGYAKISKIVRRIGSTNQDLEFFDDRKWTVWIVDNMDANILVLPVSSLLH